VEILRSRGRGFKPRLVPTRVFPPAAQNVKSARYRDVLDSREGFVVIDNSPSSKFGQRLRLYCVPIPGQTQWADDLVCRLSILRMTNFAAWA
jgi:hypothetical protein